MSVNNEKLSKAIARHIFKAGDEPFLGSKGLTHRIAFMGGESYKAEAPMGGFCEEALARCIKQFLDRPSPKDPQ